MAKTKKTNKTKKTRGEKKPRSAIATQRNQNGRPMHQRSPTPMRHGGRPGGGNEASKKTTGANAGKEVTKRNNKENKVLGEAMGWKVRCGQKKDPGGHVLRGARVEGIVGTKKGSRYKVLLRRNQKGGNIRCGRELMPLGVPGKKFSTRHGERGRKELYKPQWPDR